jgi:predicted HD superfamily hydrolase involved in NAD metabolism
VTPTYDDALSAITGRFEGDALEHCVRVAETAEALAQVYAVDTDRAAIAGLLHDWDRNVSEDALVERAAAYGVPVTDADRTQPYLLHARTGGAAVREALPGTDGAVISAIERHTVGAPDMSPLDMVVYVADMIEPARDYPGADDLREIVGTVDLDTLFARCYEHTLSYLVAGRRRIHPETVAVWNALVDGGRL